VRRVELRQIIQLLFVLDSCGSSEFNCTNQVLLSTVRINNCQYFLVAIFSTSVKSFHTKCYILSTRSQISLFDVWYNTEVA
jgi:hypothetical protein